MIHPTAVIHPRAQVDPSVVVGPHSVIDEHVVLGAHCVLGPHVYLTGHTTIGVGNRFHAGCVIGDTPQDLKYHGEPTRLRLGDHNLIREHVTIQCSNNLEEDTVIGSHCFITTHAHVGHNARIGNHVILGGGSQIAGHVTVGDRAFLSGNCLVHQFCRIGTLALMQGGSAISKDLPPYTIARGVNGISGLNSIGLRRAGVTSEQRLELRKLYHLLFRGGQRMSLAVAAAREQFTSAPALALLDFVAATKRGICADRSKQHEEEAGD